MTDNYHKLFQKLELAQPPVNLEDKIISAIKRRARRAARLKLAMSGFLFYLSGFLSIVAVKFVGAELAASGFTNYLSIIFSDGLTILPFWKEFALAVTESAPVLGFALLAIATFTLLVSLKTTFENPKNYQFNSLIIKL